MSAAININKAATERLAAIVTEIEEVTKTAAHSIGSLLLEARSLHKGDNEFGKWRQANLTMSRAQANNLMAYATAVDEGRIDHNMTLNVFAEIRSEPVALKAVQGAIDKGDKVTVKVARTVKKHVQEANSCDQTSDHSPIHSTEPDTRTWADLKPDAEPTREEAYAIYEEVMAGMKARAATHVPSETKEWQPFLERAREELGEHERLQWAYTLLGLGPQEFPPAKDTLNILIKAYRSKAHPDKGGSDEAAHNLTTVISILTYEKLL